MAMLFSTGSESAELTPEQLRMGLEQGLAQLGARQRVLAIPPDASRIHSRAGELTRGVHAIFGDRLKAVLPALGTHNPMSEAALERMFGDMPRALFRVHRWREDVRTLGEVPAAFVREQSEGRLDYSWPAQVNRLLLEGPGDGEGPFDLIVSLGQVVPHEVIGMANHNKNILVGTGGVESIDRSHFLGAVYGMERIMGRSDTPVRRVLNEASALFLRELPIVYVLTVIGRNAAGMLVVRGLFIGEGEACFLEAAELSRKTNITLLDRPIQKAVVQLDAHEYSSTWLGNKAIYRLRMALADDAELIILAPGVREFGEDPAIDRLIREHGYRGTPATLAAVAGSAALQGNLSAAAHLIHGSTEGRFRVTYCPGGLSREEVERAGYGYGDLGAMRARYACERLEEGWNSMDGEEMYFVSNPGLGLWAGRERFEQKILSI